MMDCKVLQVLLIVAIAIWSIVTYWWMQLWANMLELWKRSVDIYILPIPIGCVLTTCAKRPAAGRAGCYKI